MTDPNEGEINCYKIGGHNATTLATLMYAGRVGISVPEARRRLLAEIEKKPLPYVTPEEMQ